MISVNSGSEAYSIEEIESLMLAQEARIDKHSKELDSASVNIASHGNLTRNYPGQ